MVFKVQRISPAIFGFALFCFLLPFVTLSCPGGQLTFFGTQLALGTTVKAPDMFGQGMFQVSFGIGYWLALLASCLTVAFNAALSKLFPGLRVEPAAEPSAPVTPGQLGS